MKLRFLALPACLLGACGQGSPTWTLYRTDTAGGDRVHMATFDADDTGGGTHKFNEINCGAAAEMFQAATNEIRDSGQPQMTYWCEEGGYKSAG